MYGILITNGYSMAASADGVIIPDSNNIFQ